MKSRFLSILPWLIIIALLLPGATVLDRVWDGSLTLNGSKGLILKEIAAPGAAPSGKVELYAKSDGLLYGKDDAGTETALSNGSTAAFTKSFYLKATEGAGSVDPPTASVAGLGQAYRFADTGANEKVTFQVRMPGDYNGGNLTISAYGASEYTISAGNVYVIVEAGDAADGGSVPPSMGTPDTQASAMAAAAPGVLKQEIVNFAAITPGGSPAADRLMTITFARGSDNVADTFTNGLFHLVGLRVEYTTTGLGE